MQKLIIGLSLFAMGTSQAFAATCIGEDPCRACTTCGYCKRCAKMGGTCGVCKPGKAHKKGHKHVLASAKVHTK